LEGLSYFLLTDKEKDAYKILENAVLNHARGCDVARVDRSIDIMRILGAVLSDYPEVIYFNRTLLRTNRSFFSKHIAFTGIVPESDERQREKRLEEALNDAVYEIDKSARDDREILQGISEFLQRSVKYDQDELNAMASRRFNHCPDSHNAYGALVNHLAVCDGFSAAFSLLARELGFRSMMVEGVSNYNRTRNVQHAWNIVEFNKSFYHVDSTWDQSMYKNFEQYPYFYFGLTDDEIAIDHEWDYRFTPKCSDEGLSYYRHNNLVAYSEEQIDAIALRELRLGKKTIRIKVAVNIPVPNDDGEYIGKRVLAQESKAGLTNRIRFIWNECARCFVAILV